MTTGLDQARWLPTRAGLVSLWRFWEETFLFHQGRLLLRGPNGAGKSLALELLLPFLLDADSSPSRLTSAAKSRGGLYDRIMTGSDEASRTGYAWVEFSRGEEVFTVGARLRTSSATRKVDAAYFTTAQRIGSDLLLLSPDRVPLSRRDLEQAIGEHGRVHASSEQHRDAVRDVLFTGFTPDRYASVITALLALRKEKLSQNLDLAKLSEVLSDALAPLDEHDLAAVAEGFERLDRRRAALERLALEVREVRLLADRQRDYARAVLRSLTADVRSAESRRDNVTRDEREARASLDSAQQAAEALTAEAEAVETRLEAIGVEREALRDRDAYQEGSGLADLRLQVERLRVARGRAQQNADRTETVRDKAEVALEEAVEREHAAVVTYRQAWDEVQRAAVRVGAESLTTELPADRDAPPPEVTPVREGRSLLDAWVVAQRDRVREVRQALEAHREALRHRDFAQGRVEDDESTLEDRVAAEAASAAELAESFRAFGAAVAGWLGMLSALDGAAVAAALPTPAEDPEEVRAALQVVASDQRSAHDLTLAGIDERRRSVRAERIPLTEERDRLSTGRDVEPAVPLWRTERPRGAGAPLWRLVEVGADTEPSTVDGLESALTAAGLLDAWLRPDGGVELPEHLADVLLTSSPLAGETLGDWLAPLEGGEVPVEVVRSALHSIRTVATVDVGPTAAPHAAEEVVLGRDGTFRLGSAVGRGPRGPAVALGAEARRRRRAARLAELAGQLRRLDERQAELGREDEQAARSRAAVLAELDAAPDGRPVVEARGAVVTARTRSAEVAERLTRSRDQLRETEQQVREALRRLMGISAQHRLPTEQDALAEVERALTAFSQFVATWVARAEDVRRTVETRSRCADWAEAAREHVDAAEQDLATVVADLAASGGRLETLETNVGVEYAGIVALLDSLSQERAAVDRRRRALAQDIPRAQRQIGELTSRLSQAESARVAADEHRLVTHARLAKALQDGLGVDARVSAPAVLDGATAALTASRELAAELGPPSESGELERTNARLEERVHRAQEVIGGRSDLDRRLVESGWWVLSALVAGLRGGVTELRSSLEQEVEIGREEFAAEEERLFEQVLAGDVRRALAGRIRLATRLVDGINAQLDKVRTQAGGVGVRLRWDVDPQQLSAVKSARTLLLRDPRDLTDEESGALQEFVRARVEQARAELDPTAPWEARLRETLDYRSWHRFTLQISHRDWDGYRDATPTLLQRLSTGERSIALHLPMMASVAAHYADETGEPSTCPRLILLDELFAGVDPANRAQLFGTFTAWGLDAVLTSDHEWCQYASLDGIAIHHLHPPQGQEPVTTTRFTWDGRQRRLDPVE